MHIQQPVESINQSINQSVSQSVKIPDFIYFAAVRLDKMTYKYIQSIYIKCQNDKCKLQMFKKQVGNTSCMDLQLLVETTEDCCQVTTAPVCPLGECHTECERCGYTRSQDAVNVTDKYLPLIGYCYYKHCSHLCYNVCRYSCIHL